MPRYTSADRAKTVGMVVLVLLAATSLPVAKRVATRLDPLDGGRWPVGAFAQQPPPEVATKDGWMVVTHRLQFDGLPFVLTLEHSDTGDGPQVVVGPSDQVDFHFALGLDWAAWAAQGNAETSAPQNYAYVVIEDPAGRESSTNGATGFIQSLYEKGSGAHNWYSPGLSGEYTITGYVNEPANVVVRTTMRVEIVEPTATPTVAEPAATRTVTDPTLTVPVVEPTDVADKEAGEGEPLVNPWVPLLVGLLGGSGAMAYLLANGLLGPLTPAGGGSPPIFSDPTAPGIGPAPVEDLPPPVTGEIAGYGPTHALSEWLHAHGWTWHDIEAYQAKAEATLADLTADALDLSGEAVNGVPKAADMANDYIESYLGPAAKPVKIPYVFLKEALSKYNQAMVEGNQDYTMDQAVKDGIKAVLIDQVIKPTIAGGKAPGMKDTAASTAIDTVFGPGGTHKRAVYDVLSSQGLDEVFKKAWESLPKPASVPPAGIQTRGVGPDAPAYDLPLQL